MFLKPSFFEMIQKIVANVICISQGVIIFCAPNKMDTEKVWCWYKLLCFSPCVKLQTVLAFIFTHTGLSDSLLDIKILPQCSTTQGCAESIFDCARHLCARAACYTVLYT